MLDREKLAAVLGMLGSDHDGEVLAAARQAERIREGSGASWHDIVCPAPDNEVVSDPLGAVFELLANAGRLTEAELEFCIEVKHQDRDCSPKQIAEIERLLKKVRRSQGRAAT